MNVNDIGSSSNISSSQDSFDAGGMNELDGEAFLQLLVAQIQNQDPMNPMEDRDFIAQMAQFSTLTEMQSMVQNQLTMLGASLLGNRYSIETSAGEQIEGTIDTATWQNGNLVLKTEQGQTLQMDQISSLQQLQEQEG